MAIEPKAVVAESFVELVMEIARRREQRVVGAGLQIDGFEIARLLGEILIPGCLIVPAARRTLAVEDFASLPVPVTAANRIRGVWLRCNVAPVGADIKVTLKKNDAPITAVGGLAIPDGARGAWYLPDVLTDVTVATGDWLGIDVTQVGSTTPGKDLVVAVYWDVLAKLLGI